MIQKKKEHLHVACEEMCYAERSQVFVQVHVPSFCVFN